MTVTTRSGRVIKKPDRYEPVEQVTDDFSDSEYDSECSDDSDCDSIMTESTVFSYGEDEEDDEGNLKGFVVDSDEEEEEPEEPEESEEEESDVESDEEEKKVQKKTKKRKKVKCEETA